MTPASKRGGRRPPAEPGLSADDLALWQRATREIAPLKDKKEKEPSANSWKIKEKKEDAPRVPTPRAAPPRPPSEPPLSAGGGAGVDKRTAGRLRRGELQIEARLDLHGMTLEQAHRALAPFLLAAREAGRRTVLVITGKGRRSEGSLGVLRDAVPRWLNEPGLRPQIVAFCHAQPRHGGDGAYYVLLRRQR